MYLMQVNVEGFCGHCDELRVMYAYSVTVFTTVDLYLQ
jgi:hypothetical protein